LIGEFEQEEQELMATLSQAYLEWERRTEQRGIEQGIGQGIEQGERSLILRQLSRRVGELPTSVRSQVEALPLGKLEALGEALLEFSNLSDLEAWLNQQA
jgi:predicted transposase YdaD